MKLGLLGVDARIAEAVSAAAERGDTITIGCDLPTAGPLADLVAALRAAGHGASASGVMAAQVRSDAPWPELLAICRRLAF